MILQLLLLTFLTRRIGYLAMRKGVKTFGWKLCAITAWIIGDVGGCLLAMTLFGNKNEVALFAIGLISAFIGYSIVKTILAKKPDIFEINTLSPASDKQ